MLTAGQRTEIASALHAGPYAGVFTITGGGTLLISDLLTVPGGSASVLRAAVPYSRPALSATLGLTPLRACCEDVALGLAARGFVSASAEVGHDAALGFGMTAALVTRFPRRGRHRAIAAVQTADGTWLAEVEFLKRAALRDVEERAAADLGLTLLDRCLRRGSADDGEPPTGLRVQFEPAAADVDAVRAGRSGLAWTDPPSSPPRGILSGSFNPPHVGHARLRAAAARQIGGPVYFELSICNADKPPIDDITLVRRCRNLNGPVALTRAATFAEKAFVFPGCVFVIGYDTAVRVLDPKYYASGIEKGLSPVREAGCQFLVAARWDGVALRTLDEIAVPRAVASLFASIPPHEFREDVSSSAIRAASLGGG